MRLDDLMVLDRDVLLPGRAVRSVTRAEVLQAALTDPCPACIEGRWVGIRSLERCDRCDGRGWLPAEGVRESLVPTDDERSLVRVLYVPLSMLEGDDT